MLSFDQSSAKTGFCYLYDNEKCGVVFDSGIIDKSKIKDAVVRFGEMCKDIFKLIDEVKPDTVYIEETAMQSNVKTLRLLSQLQGAIISYCCIKGIEYSIIKPSQWRKALEFKQGKGIKREELKQQAIDYIYDNYGFTVADDEAEAICIGLSQL